MSFRAGFIAIVGPPNVGKSTLLNRVVGSKVAIVSPKPQTTRNRIRGILTGEDYQMVFLDTPGVHRTQTALHRSMVESALATLREVDIIVVMADATRPDQEGLKPILKRLKKKPRLCLAAINKIDQCSKPNLLPIMAALNSAYPFEEILPISALSGDGVPALIRALLERLPPGPRYFPGDLKSDQPESFWVGELIREKIYLHARHELPYACAVTVEQMDEDRARNLLSISARIHVERASQRGILVGKAGRMIKTIGRAARLDMERLFGVRVFLDLHVRVEKDWSRDTRALRRLGY